MRKKDMSELSQLKQDIRNLKTTYNNKKNRAIKFENLYKQEKGKNEELHKLNETLKEKLEISQQTNEEYAKMKGCLKKIYERHKIP